MRRLRNQIKMRVLTLVHVHQVKTRILAVGHSHEAKTRMFGSRFFFFSLVLLKKKNRDVLRKCALKLCVNGALLVLFPQSRWAANWSKTTREMEKKKNWVGESRRVESPYTREVNLREHRKRHFVEIWYLWNKHKRTHTKFNNKEEAALPQQIPLGSLLLNTFVHVEAVVFQRSSFLSDNRKKKRQGEWKIGD